MFFTESELQEFKDFVCLSVATKLRVPEAEFQPAANLQKLILQKNEGLAAVLAAFISAYDEWYQFHVRIDVAGKSGNLDGAETSELMRLIQERDDTRNSLLKGLAAAAVV